MPLPGFGPVFPPHPGQDDFAGTNFQSAATDSPQSGGNVRTGFSWKTCLSLEINRHRADAGFDVEINGRWLIEGGAYQFGDGIFRLGRRGDENFPKQFMFHLSVGRASSRAVTLKNDPCHSSPAVGPNFLNLARNLRKNRFDGIRSAEHRPGSLGKSVAPRRDGARRSDFADFSAVFHLTQSRQGVKLSSSISFNSGCKATCVTLVYSISNEFIFGSGRSSKIDSIMRMTPPWLKMAMVSPG